MFSSTTLPHIVTEIPGPKARALIERDHVVTSPSLPHPYPLVVDFAQGCTVTDVDGNRFLDFAAGIAVCATGHCHPSIVQAIHDQADRLIHICGSDFYYHPYTDLSVKLTSLAPGPDPWQVFLTNSGTEAVEGALKLARHVTGRHQFIAFLGSFHGRTLGALSLTASKPKYRQGFGPLLPGVVHAPYGDCFHCHFNLQYPDCSVACVDYIERELFKHIVPAQDVAAIIVEPILGEGGYVVPPSEWLPALRILCDRHDILLIADEVQSGMGRTGKMFALEHFGVVPDVITLAKGIASGMPLGAFIVKKEYMTWPKGSHGSTFGGNPVACAASLQTIALLEEDLMRNASQMGAYLLEGLKVLHAKHPDMADVRGLGLMLGIEFTSSDRASRVAKQCFQQGLIALECGEKAIRLSPPLVVDQHEADTALAILDATISREDHD